MKKYIPQYDDLSMLSASLSHMLSAGIAPADGLYLLAEDAGELPLGAVLRQMAQDADAGCSLAQCFEKAGVFPQYMCALLNVGQQVGKTEQVLAQLSQYYYDMARLRQQLRSALTYPAVLLAVLLAVLTVLLIWVMPVFDSVYRQLGGSLTGFSGTLLGLGVLLRRMLPWIMGAALLLAALALLRPIRQFISGLLGDKGIRRRIHNARFMQALTLGIGSGMTAAEACQMAEALAGNVPAFRKRLEKCRALLQQGGSLSAALKECAFVSAGENRLLEAGSRSGKLEAAMADVARRQLDRSQEQVAALVEKAEPAVVIVACLLIGAVLLSVMLPLLNIMNTVGM